jgi:hypothetical protein
VTAETDVLNLDNVAAAMVRRDKGAVFADFA